MPNFDALLAELRVAPCYREVLLRMLERAGGRAGDLAQEFALRLIEGREAGLPEPESVALSACRRWLRRERIDDCTLRPLTMQDADGKERERALEPLPQPIPASRAQIRWGRRAEAISIPVLAAPDPLLAAVRRLPMPERRALQAVYGITGPARRGRRSREVLRLAERAVERLRQALAPEHFAAKLLRGAR